VNWDEKSPEKKAKGVKRRPDRKKAIHRLTANGGSLGSKKRPLDIAWLGGKIGRGPLFTSGGKSTAHTWPLSRMGKYPIPKKNRDLSTKQKKTHATNNADP